MARVVIVDARRQVGEVEPDFVEDFEDYANIANFLTDPNGWYSPGEAVNAARMSFGSGLNAGGHSLTRSLRYTWPNNGASCASYSITNRIVLANAGVLGANQSEVWTEIWLRFSESFQTEWGAAGCEADYKLYSLGYVGAGTGGDPGGRYGTKTGTFNTEEIYIDTPNADYQVAFTGALPLWDNAWHVVRQHTKIGPDGLMRAEVDFGVGFCEIADIDVDPDLMNGLILGMNLNEGPNTDGMYVDWGRVAIWTTDPEWGF